METKPPDEMAHLPRETVFSLEENIIFYILNIKFNINIYIIYIIKNLSLGRLNESSRVSS